MKWILTRYSWPFLLADKESNIRAIPIAAAVAPRDSSLSDSGRLSREGQQILTTPVITLSV